MMCLTFSCAFSVVFLREKSYCDSNHDGTQTPDETFTDPGPQNPFSESGFRCSYDSGGNSFTKVWIKYYVRNKTDQIC